MEGAENSDEHEDHYRGVQVSSSGRGAGCKQNGARREMASGRCVSNDTISRPLHTGCGTATLASVVGCGAASQCFIWSGAA